MIGRGHRGRVDRNQPAIVKALRDAGCSVQSLAKIGDGCPDLLVGRAGVNYLLEVKDGDAPPSKRKLTLAEFTWIGKWRGAVHVVHSVAEALAVVGVKTSV